MNNPRKYGKAPYNIVVIHGGPGAPGELALIAKELSENFGIIEPLQTEKSIKGQVQELHTIINNFTDIPVKLIGHSWGAWLAFIYTANFTSFVDKLILVGAGAFEEKYNPDLMKIRLNRLSENENSEAQNLLELLNNPNYAKNNEIFKQFGKLMSKTDAFNPLSLESDVLEYQPDIFQSVWKEAKELRKSGKLLKSGYKIKCPVVAIHGDYDPHPIKGVEEPLSKTLIDFKFIKLDKCGHCPWNEKNARDEFFNILRKELL
ncbi:MAG: alpha/beta hydrolase [Bacteroidales bacterium]|nr:alpha/beta hydrolase [Bacteroidales bacterium]